MVQARRRRGPAARSGAPETVGPLSRSGRGRTGSESASCAIPLEPSTYVLLATGLVLLGFIHRRRTLAEEARDEAREAT